MPCFSSPDIHTEWMTFRRYITRQPKATDSMLVETCPHLSDLAMVT